LEQFIMTQQNRTATADLAAEGVKKPDWAALLDQVLTDPGHACAAYRRFHNYSFGNALLAWGQAAARGLPIGPIASFNAWKGIGRQVKKGEKALALVMPVTVKSKDAAAGDGDAVVEDKKTGARTIFLFKRNWFLLDQTEPIPGQEGDAVPVVPEFSWDKALALATLDIRQVPFEHPNGNCMGYAKGREIAVSQLAAFPWKTTFHETAHVILGHTAEAEMSDDERTPRSIMEAEAESVAYLCCATLELPGLAESRAYVQDWLYGDGVNAEEREKFKKRSASRIFSTVDKILRAGRQVAAQNPESCEPLQLAA
jgi:antirestriction protein ArdC